MEESGVFEYWFALIFALGFCVWFPAYVIKTKGRGIPLWGLAFCIVFLFLILPLINVGIAQESLPFVWNTMFEGIAGERPHIVQQVTMQEGSLHRKASLDQVFLLVCGAFLLVSVVQSVMAAWMLYVRHNRRSLFRAIRFMWCSALMTVCAASILPFLFLGKLGEPIVYNCALYISVYIAILLGITAYIRFCPEVAKFYPS